MNRKFYYTILVLITLFLTQGLNNLNAQVSSIIDEEVKKHITYDELVLKGRDLLLQTLREENNVKAAEILNYLNQKHDSNYVKEAITIKEKVLVQILIGQFDNLISDEYFTKAPTNRKYSYYYGNLNSSYPDQLAHQIVEEAKSRKSAITTSIQNNSSLSQQEKDFLKLLLQHYSSDFPHRSNVSVNKQADQFLQDHPNSIYEPFIRSEIRKVYVLSDWGLNYEMSAGYMEGTEYIGNTFEPGFAFGFGGGVTYKHLLFKLDIHLGITSPTQDIRLRDTIWKKGHSSNIGQFATSVGYIIAPQKRVSVIPLIGIGTTSITPSQGSEADQNRYDDVGYKAKVTYFAGLGLKYKLKEHSRFFGTSQSYLMLNYRFSEPKLDQGYTGVNGQIHLFTLSYGGFYRGNERLK